MKILLFGAGGAIGSAIASELVQRGHEVTGASRSGQMAETLESLSIVEGDATDPACVAGLAAGHDAVVSAVGPRPGDGDEEVVFLRVTQGLIEGLRLAGVSRLVVLGSAGTLQGASGQLLLDGPDFRPEDRPTALAQAKALGLLRWADDLDWTYIAPAAVVEPGARTGTYRLDFDQLVVDDDGQSRITLADLAVAFADELEQANALRQRMTVAY
jgi:putative NADH-flavin reductase